jgi:hypothetical protein
MTGLESHHQLERSHLWVPGLSPINIGIHIATPKFIVLIPFVVYSGESYRYPLKNFPPHVPFRWGNPGDFRSLSMTFSRTDGMSKKSISWLFFWENLIRDR